MDQHARPLDHAVVQIQNDYTLSIRSYITAADGKYHFAGLSPNLDYELTADYDGLRSRARTLSDFDSRADSKVNLTIRFAR
jgi:hypothetical protein